MDVGAILHVRNLPCDHSGMSVPSVLHEKFSVVEYQGTLGPTTATFMPVAGPTHKATAAAYPQGTYYFPFSALTSPHHDFNQLKPAQSSSRPRNATGIVDTKALSLPCALVLDHRPTPLSLSLILSSG